MESMSVKIPETIVQRVKGAVEEETVIVKLTEDFIKHINNLSKGNVYFKSIKSWDEKIGVKIAHAFGFAEAGDLLQDAIREYVLQYYIEKNGDVKEITIDKDTLDLTKFTETVQKELEQIKKEEEERKKRAQISERLKQICEEKTNNTFKFECIPYSEYVSIEVYVNINGFWRHMDTLRLRYNESIDALKNYDAYSAYLSKITKEKEELQDELEMLKQKYHRLVEFLKEEGLADRFRKYMEEKIKEEKEDEIDEYIDEQFPEIFEDEEDYDC